MANYTPTWIPATKGYARIFLIEGRARADHEPQYQSCLAAGSPSRSYGDVSTIECPDPDRYNNWVEVGTFQGAIERAAVPLTGRYALDIASELLRIADTRCAADIQVHFGKCTDPRDFNTFNKILMFEDSLLTNWSAEDLIALSSDENAQVNEATDISAGELYEVLPLAFTERAKDVVINEVIDVVICDFPSCGDCEWESDGCRKIYALTLAGGGSPGSAADVVYSLDKGAAWAADDINTLHFNEDPNALACVDTYVVVVSEDDEAIHYKLQATIDAGTALGWTRIATGIVATNGPLDIWSVGSYAFIVGENGYVYGTSDPTAGVTVLDAGVAETTDDLHAVHAISDAHALAVGLNDSIIYTQNQTYWQATTAVTGGGMDLYACWMMNESEWWVAGDVDANGDCLYYTLDSGVTWTAKSLPGTQWARIDDIGFSTPSVGYLAGYKTTTRGFMLRTYDGGYSWVVLPEGVGTLPLADRYVALAACEEDPNFVVGVGLGDTPPDGIIVVGQD